MSDTRTLKQRRTLLGAVLSYWILAAPAALKCLGGYILGQETGNRIVEVLYSWFCLLGSFPGREIPFWASQVHAGTMVVGNPELAILHPATQLIRWFQPEVVINGVLYATPAMAACFMFAFARHLQLSIASSWLAGLIYGFHAFVAAQLYGRGNWNFALTYPYLPLVLLAGSLIMRQAKWGDVGLLALSVGAIVLGSSIPLIAFAAVLLVAECAILAFSAKGEVLPRLLKIGLGIVLGLSIASPHLVPLSHFWSQTANSVPMESARDYSFDRLLPEHIVSFLFPRFFGDEINSVYWGRLSYLAVATYSGAATILLCVAGLFWRKRVRLMMLSLLGGAGCLFLAAEILPIYGWLSRIPGWVQATSSPAVFIAPLPLFLALLAAGGWEFLRETSFRIRRRIGQTIVFATLFGAALGWLYFGKAGATGYYWTRLVNGLIQDPFTALSPELVNRVLGREEFLQGCYLVAQESVIRFFTVTFLFGIILVFGFGASNQPRAAALGLLALLFATDIGGFFHSLQGIYPTALLKLPASIETYLRETTGHDYRTMAPADPELAALPSRHGLNSVWQRTPFVFSDYLDLIKIQERQPTFYAPGLMVTRLTPITQALGVKIVLTRPNRSFSDPMTTLTQQTTTVWAYATTGSVLRRASIPREVIETTSPTHLLFNVASMQWRPDQVAYIDKEALDWSPTAPQTDEVTATITRQTFREISIRLSEKTTVPVVLLLTDSYDPWWHVSGDGGTVLKTCKADWAFRAILVPPGIQTVQLTYRVPGWEIWTTLCGLAFITSASLGLLIARKQTPRR